MSEAKRISDALRSPGLHQRIVDKSIDVPRAKSASSIELVRRGLARDQPSTTTYEISNVGAVKTLGPDGDEWRFGEDAVFSQSNGPQSEIFDFSCISIRNRYRIMLSYLNSRVEPDDAQAVCARLIHWLEQVAHS